jgi:hypothetical protein
MSKKIWRIPMKIMMLLFLTVSLSQPAFSDDAHKKAPSTDHAVTKEKTGQQDVYEESDTLKTNQSSTTRQEYKSEGNYKTCRDANGSWLKPGDTGYADCMNNTKMMKR